MAPSSCSCASAACPPGASLLLGRVAVTLDANGYYGVPYDRINDLRAAAAQNSQRRVSISPSKGW